MAKLTTNRVGDTMIVAFFSNKVRKAAHAVDIPKFKIGQVVRLELELLPVVIGESTCKQINKLSSFFPEMLHKTYQILPINAVQSYRQTKHRVTHNDQLFNSFCLQKPGKVKVGSCHIFSLHLESSLCQCCSDSFFFVQIRTSSLTRSRK
jgi:hypothetical protein